VGGRIRRRRPPALCRSTSQICAADPLRERRWELLALPLYRCGRQAEALRAVAKRTWRLAITRAFGELVIRAPAGKAVRTSRSVRSVSHW
ncbi:MAG: BTAD domain-containing putative transcriptional regulator, partial [Gammaproteobacteria bacterium]